ncbi:MAG TPA: hypothetical protein VMF30_10350 [Pirellulales bacterium]|nr:hypothetical protein [Pirellulales bacterium]
MAKRRRPIGNKGSREARRAPHVFTSADILDFVELPAFTRRWENLGLDDEEDLTALQFLIMLGPKAAPVIPGTRAIRKIRFAPPKWNVGKSGACRVLYVCFERFRVVLLAVVYDKHERDDISASEKRILNNIVDVIEAELKIRYS